MNLNNANLMVGKAASTDPARVGLQSIHVTADYTESTNGHILARVSLPFQYDPEDLPLSIKTEDAEYIEPFTIPAKAAMAIKLFKSKGNIPCLSDSLYVDVESSNVNGTARFIATDRETTITPELSKIDTVFPDTSRVIPTFSGEEDRRYHTRLSIPYLETLLAVAKSTGADWISLDAIPAGPVLVQTENNGQKFTGVIMPLRDL